MENPTDFLWWRDGVIYQIYPRSFADSNGDGIGDLPGIMSRLDYLADLGIDAIWLSPIYPSPDVDFGYDVADYLAIDPRFGSMEDFDRLVEAAHRRGIRVILDLVLNHTSDRHPWFQESRRSRDNLYHDWYLWRDPRPGGRPPNNWASVFGGRGWEFEPQRGQYYFHMFYKEQPDLNWRNPAVRQAMLDVFRFWLERGVDGFRLDVFNVYFKHPEFPNNPPRLGLRAFDRQHHIFDIDQPEMIPLLREIRAILDAYPERYAVGETFLSTPEKAARYCAPGLLHATFDFTFLHCPWRPERFLRTIQAWEQALGAEAWPTYVLNNHDNPRAGTRYARGEDDARLKVAATLLLTLRGTPFMYYGEEIGMRDIRVSRAEIKDPIGKRYWPFYKGRDGCRAPMQWDDSLHAGFTTGTPWLPVHPNYRQRNVEAQLQDEHSLLNYYRRLLRLRKEKVALRRGLFQPLTFEPRRLLAYLRQDKYQTILVALNFSPRPVRLALGGTLQVARWRPLLSTRGGDPAAPRDGFLALQGNEAIILERED
ncbi:alpha-glucosidase [uncultured Thermanaerothrix sp.]|uniref:glycoside hydrolase family 13 protein n=1 Tax=uncultured Thermanaerothrix sp. TaxID=1195149 RepID=UPI00261C421A|nr:alpha-glucosidase [uncultured Thermanaerothrix sp.]